MSSPSPDTITLGAAGAVLASQVARVQIPAPAADVVDTVGAGDTFMAAMIDFIIIEQARAVDEGELWRMGVHAAGAAAITVRRRGADLPYRRELQIAEAVRDDRD